MIKPLDSDSDLCLTIPLKRNKIDINCDKTSRKILRDHNFTIPELRKLIQLIMTVLQLTGKEISLLFCDNLTIHQLNLGYRQKDKPTDVLSFPSDSNTFLGDIAISLEKVIEQALEYEFSFEDELKRLLIHGILHLLGYDHELGKREEQEMKLREEAITKEVKHYHLC